MTYHSSRVAVVAVQEVDAGAVLTLDNHISAVALVEVEDGLGEGLGNWSRGRGGDDAGHEGGENYEEVGGEHLDEMWCEETWWCWSVG